MHAVSRRRHDVVSAGRSPLFVLIVLTPQVMVCLLMTDRADEALGYWRQLVCINGLNGVDISQETYNLAIKSAAKAGALEEMDTVLGMMQVMVLLYQLALV